MGLNCFAGGLRPCGRFYLPWCGYRHLRLLLGGVFGGRLHAHVGACWAAVFNAFHGRLWALFCGSCGRTWALVGGSGSVACVLHECACELVCAQLTFGCLDVAVISTRVNHVGIFLRRAEPASTLDAWAGLGSGFFGVFSCVFPWLQVFFWRAEGPHKPRPHMKFAGFAFSWGHTLRDMCFFFVGDTNSRGNVLFVFFWTQPLREMCFFLGHTLSGKCAYCFFGGANSQGNVFVCFFGTQTLGEMCCLYSSGHKLSGKCAFCFLLGHKLSGKCAFFLWGTQTLGEMCFLFSFGHKYAFCFFWDTDSQGNVFFFWRGTQTLREMCCLFFWDTNSRGNVFVLFLEHTLSGNCVFFLGGTQTLREMCLFAFLGHKLSGKCVCFVFWDTNSQGNVFVLFLGHKLSGKCVFCFLEHKLSWKNNWQRFSRNQGYGRLLPPSASPLVCLSKTLQPPKKSVPIIQFRLGHATFAA